MADLAVRPCFFASRALDMAFGSKQVLGVQSQKVMVYL